MVAVRLIGVASLKCKESVPTLQIKNLKEHFTWCIDYKLYTIYLTKATRNAIS